MNPTSFSSTQNLAVRIADRLYPVVGHATGYELSEVGPLFLETFVLFEGQVKELTLVAKGRPYWMFAVTPEQLINIANGGDHEIHQTSKFPQGIASRTRKGNILEVLASKFSGVSEVDLATMAFQKPGSEQFRSQIKELLDAGLIQRVESTGNDGKKVQGYQLAL